MSFFTKATNYFKEAGKKVSKLITKSSGKNIDEILDNYQKDIYSIYFEATMRMVTNLVSHIEVVDDYNTISNKLDKLSTSIENKKTQEYYKKNFIPLKLKDRKSKILVYQKEIIQCRDSGECMIPKGNLKSSIEKSFELYSLFKKYINLGEEHDIIRSHIDTTQSLESYILDGIDELLEEIYPDNIAMTKIKKNDNAFERYLSIEKLMKKYTDINTYRNLIVVANDDIVEFKNVLSTGESGIRQVIDELKGYKIYKSSENSSYISIKVDKTLVAFVEPNRKNYKINEYDITNMETYGNFYTTQFNPQFLFKNEPIHLTYYRIYSAFVSNCQQIVSKKSSLNYKNRDFRQLSCVLHQYLSRYYSNMSSVVHNITRNTKVPSSLLSSILEDFTIDEVYSQMESGIFSYNQTKLGDIFTINLKSTPIGLVYLPSSIENAKYIYHDALVTMKLYNEFGQSDIVRNIHYCLDLFYCGIDMEKTMFSKNTICKVPYNITTFSIKTYDNYITLGYFIDRIVDRYPILVLDIVTRAAKQLCITQKTILDKYRVFCHGSLDIDNILLLALDDDGTRHNKYNQIANKNNFLFTGFYNSIVIDKHNTLYANKIDNRKTSELETMATSGNYKHILAIYDILYFLSVVRAKLVNKNVEYREVYGYLFTILDGLVGLEELLDCFNGKDVDLGKLLAIKIIPGLDELSDALDDYRLTIKDAITSETDHFTTNQVVKKLADCSIGFDKKTGEQLDYNYIYPICKERLLANVISSNKKSICEKKDTLASLNIDNDELLETDPSLRYITSSSKGKITFGTPYPENYSQVAKDFIEELDNADC